MPVTAGTRPVEQFSPLLAGCPMRFGAWSLPRQRRAGATAALAPRPSPAGRTCLRFVFLLLTRMTAWLRLSRREEAWKIAEILILRHQLAVLRQRQLRRPNLDWADRELLATLLAVVPKARRQALRLLVTPDMVLRWHRGIVRRRWAARSTRGRTGGLAAGRVPAAVTGERIGARSRSEPPARISRAAGPGALSGRLPSTPGSRRPGRWPRAGQSAARWLRRGWRRSPPST